MTLSDTEHYGSPSITLKGERVRSKGEKQIADFLFQKGIKYTYEDPAKTNISAFTKKISRPDFYLPEHKVYVEFWGLVDHKDQELRMKYNEQKHLKEREYQANGIRVLSIYPWNLDDLEGAFKAEYRKVMKKDLVLGPISEGMVRALPISPLLTNMLSISTIQNASSLPLSEVQVVFTPYYFIKYDCFVQEAFMYQKINLNSTGLLVIDANQGNLVDSITEEGDIPRLPRTGHFTNCVGLEQKETPRAKLSEQVTFSQIDALLAKITEEEATQIARNEIAKNLHRTHTYTTKRGVTHSHTIRASPERVRIKLAELVNIPIVTGIFAYRDKTYRRTIQAVTGKVLEDDFNYCYAPTRHFEKAVLICERCGNLACHSHGKNCNVCGLALCQQDVIQKGLIFKKYYCNQHTPP
ncbi:MAG: hypothetical protein HYY67_08350 [Thaumarchaeota archaeon]|nr:hypothetical protein [Nitrososphaerota archaeon]